MKSKVLKVIVPCLAVLVVVVLCIGYLTHSYRYSGKMFGKSYYHVADLYDYSGFHTSYSNDGPSYCINNDGKLLALTTVPDNGRYKAEVVEVTGKLLRIPLTYKNFDVFLNDNFWMCIRDDGKAFDGEWIRNHTVEAWCYRVSDGRFCYLLLQENGDVFLCSGLDRIQNIRLLEPAGDQELFFARIDEINDRVSRDK